MNATTDAAPAKEMVSHPAHYGGKDSIFETIKVLEVWLTHDQFIGFLFGNALKYLSRAGKKGDAEQDIRKAAWYVEYAADFLKRMATGRTGEEHFAQILADRIKEHVERLKAERPVPVRLVRTCEACPEQYDAFDGDMRVGYLRFRHGRFCVECPDAGGVVVYHTKVDDAAGIFSDEERPRYLAAAVEAIQRHRGLTNFLYSVDHAGMGA